MWIDMCVSQADVCHKYALSGSEECLLVSQRSEWKE